MNDITNSYKNLIKSTAIFGSTQIMQVIITIIRSKLIAIILGPTGMGTYFIFQSISSTIGQISSLGINQSAIRNISQAHQHRIKENNVIITFYSLVWLTSIIGFLITLIGAPYISAFAFGTYKEMGWILLLSFGILFNGLSQGKITILQGTRQLKKLSKVSLYSTICSLIISIPLYYYNKANGIVPSIIIGMIITYFITSLNSPKIKFNTIKTHFFTNIKNGLPIIKLGLSLMVSGCILTLNSLILNVFINNYGNLNDVGYFQSAFNIINQCLAIVIAVLAADYYPKISAIHTKTDELSNVIKQQIELTTLIITPISIGLIIFANYIIRILLSSSFTEVISILQWMSIALIFRCLWIIMSYIILAKGSQYLFLFFDGIIGNGVSLLMNIAAYSIWGINAIGISFAISSIMCTSVIILSVCKKYNLKIKNIKFIFLETALIVLSFYFTSISSFYISIVLFIISLFISFYILNKRTLFLYSIKKRILH